MISFTRRAPTACSHCRYRKVRCDASILGRPCTRCRQDGNINCVFRAKTKQSKRSPGQPQLPGSEKQSSRNNLNFPDVDVSDEHDETDRPRKQQCHDHLRSKYPFIDWQVLLSLPQEDVTFLFAKGALTLPDEAAVDEFVYQYFKRIHPSLPMVDEAGVSRIYYNRLPGKLSLFVFQGMLFASCSFVSLGTLRRCGFEDKRDAWKQLYNRAKLLFDLNVETKPSAKAQGAVLLSHHASLEEPQAGSLWLTRAIGNAMTMDARPSLQVDNITPSLKKRLWSSILLRDRTLCIGLRRRPQTPVKYCDWMTEDDFMDEIYCSHVYDPDEKRRLLTALQKQCQLAVLLSDLVSLIFAPQICSSRFLGPDQFDALMFTIERIRLSLVDWENQITFPRDQMEGAEFDDPVAMLTALTSMYYHAARVDLAQYTAFTIEENLTLAKAKYSQRMHQIGQDLKHSIEGLTSTLEYFSNQGHLESLPFTVLGYVGMPLILAAIDLKLSSSQEEMDARKKRLNSLSAIIRHSQTLYHVTDSLAVAINHILQLAYLTTRNVFLRQKHPTQRDLLGNSTRHIQEKAQSTETRPDHLIHKRNTHQSQSSKQFGRATSWVEAFTLWPRAYLLISTSFDHSLAVGRLPSDIALPELVRHIPAMGADFRLPWSVNLQFGMGTGGSRRHGSDQLLLPYGSVDEGTPREQPSEYDRETLGETPSNSDHGEPEPELLPEPGSLENGEQEKRTPEPTVNLDFLDLTSAVEDSLLGRHNHGNTEYQSPGDGDQTEEIHVGDLDTGSDFDLALFNSLSNELRRLDEIGV